LKKGRSPKDKRIVEEASSAGDIWWGPINFKMVENSFMVNRERAIDYLNTREKLFVFDGFAGWDPKYRIKVFQLLISRSELFVQEHIMVILCITPALFMNNMLIRPTAAELVDFGEPDFTIFNAGGFPANRYS
jgi:ATP-dependent phosphoenolpyruvate carboxykinase